MDKLSPLLYFTTANGGPDISFLRAEREVVSQLISFVSFVATFGCFSRNEGNSSFLRGSLITVSTKSRPSWASCSRLLKLRRCWTKERRRRRKVKSKTLKVRGRCIDFSSFSSSKQHIHQLLLYFVPKQQTSYSPQRLALHQMGNSLISSRNSNIASASWYVYHQVQPHYLLTRGSCIFIASVYFSGSSEINHHQSFFRGPHSPCVQASGYGESGL